MSGLVIEERDSLEFSDPKIKTDYKEFPNTIALRKSKKGGKSTYLILEFRPAGFYGGVGEEKTCQNKHLNKFKTYGFFRIIPEGNLYIVRLYLPQKQIKRERNKQ